MGFGAFGSALYIFYYGRLINTPFEVPTTRAPFLPFDGRAWDVGGTQIENPSTSWIRLIFAVLMIVVAMWRLTKVLGETRRIHRLGTLLRGPGWAAIALATVAIGLRPVGLQSAVELVLICRGTAPKVCLLSAHERDLDAAVAVAARARAAAGRQLFNATLVSEGAPARSRAAIRIAIVSDRGVDVSRSFAEQISARLVDFDACLSRRPQNPEMTSAAATIVRWYAAQSDDRAERTSDSDTVVADWGTRPDEVNGVLRTKADRVSRCQMRLTDLP